MTSTRKLPANISPEAARLLERAYGLDGDDQSLALYRDWAESYDETMLTGLGYQSPAKVAGLLARHLVDRQAALLDVGCGTGLVGKCLAEHGFVAIDGMDVSSEMMQVAARLGVYRAFINADLNQPLAIADASYGGAIGCGIFTHGHVGAGCLDELFRVLRPGAQFAFTVRLQVWESLGFRDKLRCLIDSGRITERSLAPDRHYETSVEPDGLFCVYQRN